ncbi:hypothetical protein Tco_1511344, partial [Tanacetum coccineum]
KSNCTVENQVKFTTCTLLGGALTLWNSHVKTVGHDIAYAMTWTNLKKKMTDKYCPKGEIKKLEVKMMFPEESDKIERYVSSLPDMIHESVMASKLKTMQHAIAFTIEMMDKKISTFAERQAKNKRKFEDTSKNNQNQQQNKRQNTGRAYTGGSGKKKPYGGVLQMPTPLTTKGALGQVRNPLDMNVEPKDISRGIGNETLIVRGDGSDQGNETHLNIISCTKTQKYMLKGCPIFLAHVATKGTEDKSEKK